MWGMIFSLGLKLLGWYFDKQQENSELKKKWNELLAVAQQDANLSKRQKDSIKKLHADLAEQLKSEKPN